MDKESVSSSGGARPGSGVNQHKVSDWTSGQIIALYLFNVSAVLAIAVFWMARGDHDMKLLALGCVLGFVSGASGTAGAILVGKPTTAPPSSHLPDVSQLIPGGSATSTESITAPPGSPAS